MTDPDERAINRAIACLDWDIAEKVMTTGDDLQDIREEARAALHRLFRDRRRLENRVEELEKGVDEVRRLRERLIDEDQGDGWPPDSSVWLLDQVINLFPPADHLEDN